MHLTATGDSAKYIKKQSSATPEKQSNMQYFLRSTLESLLFHDEHAISLRLVQISQLSLLATPS